MMFVSQKSKKTNKPTGQKQRGHGSLWSQQSPEDIIRAIKLQKETFIHQDQMLSILDHKTWLSSNEADSACFHLSKKFPNIDGFQSCLCFQALHQGGVVGTPQEAFIQILNVNDNPWITVSNIFCGPNELCIYDRYKSRYKHKFASFCISVV